MKYFCYRHIRPDTNEVFNVGIGTKPPGNHNKFEREYDRAFETKVGRSDGWKTVYNECGENIIVEIIYESDDYDEINAKEIEFIKIYGRADLYEGTLVNLTNGGSGERGKPMPEEVKEKLRKANLGKKINDEQRERLSKSLKGKPKSIEHRAAISSLQTKVWSDPDKRKRRSKEMSGEGNHMYGRVGEDHPRFGIYHTESTKQLISEKVRGSKHSQAKPILQYTKDGEFVKEWSYIKEAAESLGINGPCISGCCVGRYKSAGGYVWKHKESSN